MRTARSVFRDILNLKAKAFMTLFTVAVGVAVLILALSISDSFSKNVTKELASGGLIINVSNATFSDEGGIEPVRPPQFDENLPDVIRTGVPGVVAVAPLGPSRWRQVSVDDATYQLRRVVGSTPDYLEVMGLELTAGDRFTDQDIDTGAAKALVTETIAISLFGSADGAIGKTIRPPAMNIVLAQQGGGIQRRQEVAQNFVIAGVYRDPPEVQRKAYGIADVVIPVTSVLPRQMNRSMAMRFLLGTVAIKIDGIGYDAAESQIRTALGSEYGDDVSVHVWEGEPDGESSNLEATRRTVATFSLVVNLLGFVLLVTGSIGILSIMIVEVLGRSREIALERALGANKRDIVAEFFTRSVIMSSLSAALGLIMSLVFARPLSALMWPIFEGIGVTPETTSAVSPTAVLIGVLAALVVGGVFGTMPVFSTLRPPISESIRES